MSAGSNGGGMPPDHDDDPFAYLYRPEGGQSAGDQPATPRRSPSSYHQVRPVGERTYGGQQRPAAQPQAPRQPQQQPDAYYAAPETQPGGVPPQGAPPDRRRRSTEPRRNGLLIGAIAVVLAVVVGVGAAILFSGGDGNETAGGDPSASSEPTGDEGGGDSDDGGSDGDETPPADDDELPAADPASLQLSGGASLDSTVTGARSSDGSYVTGMNAAGASITWTFDFQGEPGQYFFYTGYSAISDGQTIDFSVNGEPRSDPIDTQDYNPGSDAWEESWFSTWKMIDVTQGQNTIQLTCADSCDVLVDQLYLSDHQLTDEELNAQEL